VNHIPRKVSLGILSWPWRQNFRRTAEKAPVSVNRKPSERDRARRSGAYCIRTMPAKLASIEFELIWDLGQPDAAQPALSRLADCSATTDDESYRLDKLQARTRKSRRGPSSVDVGTSFVTALRPAELTGNPHAMPVFGKRERDCLAGESSPES
jgi:hypothetical protein